VVVQEVEPSYTQGEYPGTAVGMVADAVKWCEPALAGSSAPLFPPGITRQNKQLSLEDVSLTQTSIVISREHNTSTSSFLILSLLLYIGQILTEYLSGIILFHINCYVLPV
jgi:hypothetical protein